MTFTHEPPIDSSSIYGTEVFEVNQALQKIAAGLARKATLNESDAAIEYRANYASSDLFAAAAAAPGVYECDVATSDVSLLSMVRLPHVPELLPGVLLRDSLVHGFWKLYSSCDQW